MQAKQFSGEAEIDEHRAHVRQARREADMDSTGVVDWKHVHRRQRPLECDQLVVELENLLIRAWGDAEGFVGLRQGRTIRDYSLANSPIRNDPQSS